MPIEYSIDHEKRLVLTRSYGKLTDDEIISYQRDVWSREDVAGYNELADLSAVEEFDTLSAAKLREIAALAARMDNPDTMTKFAMVAPHGLHFGLSRMYEAFRQLNPGSTKSVRTFNCREEALAWLDAEEEPLVQG